jgi:hypothetical protein
MSGPAIDLEPNIVCSLPKKSSLGRNEWQCSGVSINDKKQERGLEKLNQVSIVSDRCIDDLQNVVIEPLFSAKAWHRSGIHHCRKISSRGCAHFKPILFCIRSSMSPTFFSSSSSPKAKLDFDSHRECGNKIDVRESQSSTVEALDSRVMTRSGWSKMARKVSCASGSRLSMNRLQNSYVAAAGRIFCDVERPDGCSGRLVFRYQRKSPLLTMVGHHAILGPGHIIADDRLDLSFLCPSARPSNIAISISRFSPPPAACARKAVRTTGCRSPRSSACEVCNLENLGS